MQATCTYQYYEKAQRVERKSAQWGDPFSVNIRPTCSRVRTPSAAAPYVYYTLSLLSAEQMLRDNLLTVTHAPPAALYKDNAHPSLCIDTFDYTPVDCRVR